MYLTTLICFVCIFIYLFIYLFSWPPTPHSPPPPPPHTHTHTFSIRIAPVFFAVNGYFKCIAFKILYINHVLIQTTRVSCQAHWSRSMANLDFIFVPAEKYLERLPLLYYMTLPICDITLFWSIS